MIRNTGESVVLENERNWFALDSETKYFTWKEKVVGGGTVKINCVN